MTSFILVSHDLCPYVQRAVIVAAEKGVPYTRIDIDLANKPAWFTAISPTGKTPLLRVQGDDGREDILFESAALAEYLDEVGPGSLMPTDPVGRAKHRAWVEFASGTLTDIAGLYAAAEEIAYGRKADALRHRFIQLDATLLDPWFGGERFGLVDAAFGPVFRYLDAFEAFADLHLAAGLPKLARWRQALSQRQSVREAVSGNYPDRLRSFLLARNSHLARLLAAQP